MWRGYLPSDDICAMLRVRAPEARREAAGKVGATRQTGQSQSQWPMQITLRLHDFCQIARLTILCVSEPEPVICSDYGDGNSAIHSV